jgi:hypothetical protein
VRGEEERKEEGPREEVGQGGKEKRERVGLLLFFLLSFSFLYSTNSNNLFEFK